MDTAEKELPPLDPDWEDYEVQDTEDRKLEMENEGAPAQPEGEVLPSVEATNGGTPPKVILLARCGKKNLARLEIVVESPGAGENLVRFLFPQIAQYIEMLAKQAAAVQSRIVIPTTGLTPEQLKIARELGGLTEKPSKIQIASH